MVVFNISLPFVATMPALCASDFSGDFDAYLAKQDLPEGLIRRIINDLKISNVEVFANCVDSKEELMPTFLQGTSWENDIQVRACLRVAWRDADSYYISKTSTQASCSTSIAVPNQDIEDPLPQAQTAKLEKSFMEAYEQLRIPSDLMGSDALLARFTREFERRQPSVFNVAKVKTRLASSISKTGRRESSATLRSPSEMIQTSTKIASTICSTISPDSTLWFSRGQ